MYEKVWISSILIKFLGSNPTTVLKFYCLLWSFWLERLVPVVMLRGYPVKKMLQISFFLDGPLNCFSPLEMAYFFIIISHIIIFNSTFCPFALDMNGSL